MSRFNGFNVDILIIIFNELKENKKFLYSCLFVNREWCRLVVPFLWRNHAWSNLKKKLSNIILSLLPSSSKQLLSDNDIKLSTKLLSGPPLFDYIRYCEFPEAEVVEKIMKTVANLDNSKRNLLEGEIYQLFISKSSNLKELLWDTSQHLPSFPGASECFSKLDHLIIDISIISPKALDEMTEICMDLKKLTIYNYSQDFPELIRLIDDQRDLKSVYLFNNPFINEGTCIDLAAALARKADTIIDLHLDSVSAIQPSLLTELIKLKKISIDNDEAYEDYRVEFRKYLATSRFPDLQHLYVNKLSCFKELATLIENTKGDVSCVEIYDIRAAKDTGMLIEAIASKCPKIKTLSTYIVPNDFIHMETLLMKCEGLVSIYLDSFDFPANENENIGDELLDILTRWSPNSLTDVEISGKWKCSVEAFEIFFKSCKEQNRKLSRFNIICYENYITKKHKEVIDKYINEGVIYKSNFVRTLNS